VQWKRTDAAVMENDEIIELTRYAHPAHAHNIKMLLESNGIRTFVKNFSVPDSLADGPYVVMVRESDVP
jgi:hypothetical protein